MQKFQAGMEYKMGSALLRSEHMIPMGTGQIEQMMCSTNNTFQQGTENSWRTPLLQNPNMYQLCKSQRQKQLWNPLDNNFREDMPCNRI